MCRFTLPQFIVSFSVALSVPVPGNYYTDEVGRRLVHFDADSGSCHLFGDRRIVDEILRELVASESPAKVIEKTELTTMISQCSKENRDEISSNPKNDFPHIIYPGTKWCGTGNVAESLDDLGSLRTLDVCCRNHDICPDDLQPGVTKHNITNDSPFTISKCPCSKEFRRCLENLSTKPAKEISASYFSTGLFQCYDLVKPIMGCAQWTGLLRKSCKSYYSDEYGELKWQVMDVGSLDE